MKKHFLIHFANEGFLEKLLIAVRKVLQSQRIFRFNMQIFIDLKTHKTLEKLFEAVGRRLKPSCFLGDIIAFLNKEPEHVGYFAST